MLPISKFGRLMIIVCFLSCNSNTSKKDQLHKTANSLPGNQTQSKPAFTYQTYCNDRFSYCIDYPSSVLFPQPEPENGDGCTFKNKQAEEILTVVGSYFSEEDGIEALTSHYESDLTGEFEENGNRGRVITYKNFTKSFFVVSGYKNDKIFYHKTILKGNVLAFARLEYEESEKHIYDAVSKRIFQSFR